MAARGRVAKRRLRLERYASCLRSADSDEQYEQLQNSRCTMFYITSLRKHKLGLQRHLHLAIAPAVPNGHSECIELAANAMFSKQDYPEMMSHAAVMAASECARDRSPDLTSWMTAQHLQIDAGQAHGAQNISGP